MPSSTNSKDYGTVGVEAVVDVTDGVITLTQPTDADKQYEVGMVIQVLAFGKP